jgi:hypothetical protein
MRPAVHFLNRRTRRRIYAAAAVLSLAVWLFMAVAEVCLPLHAWLHGGTIADDDNCAVVAIAHGKVDSVDCAIPILASVISVEVAPRIELSAFSPAIACLPAGRAPPLLPSVS